MLNQYFNILSQQIRHLSHSLQHLPITNMHNQRIPLRPLLRRKDLRYCLRIKRIRPQPIHRLSRKRDRPAPTQQLCRLKHSRLSR